jgi:hypothetical protein
LASNALLFLLFIYDELSPSCVDVKITGAASGEHSDLSVLVYVPNTHYRVKYEEFVISPAQPEIIRITSYPSVTGLVMGQRISVLEAELMCHVF